MGRNNGDFKGKASSLYHTSSKENRESIEKSGLMPRKPSVDGPRGVYFSVGTPMSSTYGSDIYHVERSPWLGLKKDPEEPWNNSKYTTRWVPNSDVKRVGHIYQNPEGHAEVHWHPEEQCEG